MSEVVKKFLTFALLFLPLVTSAEAQVKTGEASLNFNGVAAIGYTDDYSNYSGSDHSILGAGSGDFSGFYYTPSFLSFDVQPYYNQSRLNSSFQSISSASGVGAHAVVFGGSHFPFSISYASSYNSTGNFNVPGLANYTTNGNNNDLTLAWAVHYDDLPTLNLSFTDANSDFSVYGSNSRGAAHSKTFSASSSYHLDGFSMNGGYQHAGYNTLSPAVLTGEIPITTDSGENSYYFNIGHKLPLRGSASFAATRLDLGTTAGESGMTDKYDTTVDTLSGSVALAPTFHLSMGGSTFYTDNLEGTIYNTLLASGIYQLQNEGQLATNDLSLTGYADYGMMEDHLHFRASGERQQQTYGGLSFSSDDLNGTASYSDVLWGGSFNGVLGLSRTTVNTHTGGTLGLNSSVNYLHTLHRWNLAGGLAYAQNSQTLLIAYTSSNFSYNGSVGRRFGRRSYWSATAGGAKSVLTDLPGSGNSTQNYSTTLSMFKWSINGSYSVSNGNALLTSTGLVSTPVPLPVVNPADVVLFNGKSYAFGFGSSPVRGLTLSASYSRALSNTNSSSIISNNNNQSMYFLMIYNFRKLYFNAGYSRLLQGFSTAGTPPALVGSLYVGVSRWFNFF